MSDFLYIFYALSSYSTITISVINNDQLLIIKEKGTEIIINITITTTITIKTIRNSGKLIRN